MGELTTDNYFEECIFELEANGWKDDGETGHCHYSKDDMTYVVCCERFYGSGEEGVDMSRKEFMQKNLKIILAI